MFVVVEAVFLCCMLGVKSLMLHFVNVPQAAQWLSLESNASLTNQRALQTY